MNREKIEAAKVGPELDALVHRHLFDAPDEWAVIKQGYYYRPNDAGYTSRLEEAGRYTEAEARRRCYPNHEPVTMERIPAPAYSTSGDGMLLVLEKMRERGFRIETSLWHKKAVASVYRLADEPFGMWLWVTDAPTLPEVVSKAALLALLNHTTTESEGA